MTILGMKSFNVNVIRTIKVPTKNHGMVEAGVIREEDYTITAITATGQLWIIPKTILEEYTPCLTTSPNIRPTPSCGSSQPSGMN